MTADGHRVDWAHFDVTFAGEMGELDPSGALVEALRTRALPAMERALDRLAGPDTVTVVDELDLDLGTLEWHGWPDRLAEALAAAVTRALGDGARSADRAAGGPPPSRRLSAREANLEVVRDFLATGRLPWRGAALGAREFDRLVFDLVRQDAAGFADAVRRWVDAGRGEVVPRLVRQLPDAALEGLLRGLAVPDAPHLPAARRALRARLDAEVGGDAAARVGREYAALEGVLRRALAGTADAGIRTLAERGGLSGEAAARGGPAEAAPSPPGATTSASDRLREALLRDDPVGLLALLDRLGPEAGTAALEWLRNLSQDATHARRIVEGLRPVVRSALLRSALRVVEPAARRALERAQARGGTEAGSEEEARVAWAAAELEALAGLAIRGGAWRPPPSGGPSPAEARTDAVRMYARADRVRRAVFGGAGQVTTAAAARGARAGDRHATSALPRPGLAAARGARAGDRDGDLPELPALVAELRSRHPELLRGVVRDLAGSGAGAADVAAHLSEDTLRALTVGYLEVHAPEASELRVALERAVRQAADPRTAQAGVLLMLAGGGPIDVEALPPPASARTTPRGDAPGGRPSDDPASDEPASGGPAPGDPTRDARARSAAGLSPERRAAAAAVLHRALARIRAAWPAYPAPDRAGLSVSPSAVPPPLDPVRALAALLDAAAPALDVARDADAGSGTALEGTADAWGLALLDRLLSDEAARGAVADLVPDHLAARLVLLLRPLSWAGVRLAGDLVLEASLAGAPASAYDVLARARRRATLDLLAEGEVATLEHGAVVDRLALRMSELADRSIAELRAGMERLRDRGSPLAEAAERLRADEGARSERGEGPRIDVGTFGRREGGSGEERRVENAGLVLVAPFLPRLFDVLGLLRGRIFRDEAAAARAVQLLQFLATGEDDAPEFLLALNMLLCGVEPGTPIPRRLEPTAAEIREVEGLLRAVIGHWAALGNTSVEGLRTSFLRRAGTLRAGGERLDLQVEPRAFDVLLDRIPWAFGIVALPWMPAPLHVEWR